MCFRRATCNTLAFVWLVIGASGLQGRSLAERKDSDHRTHSLDDKYSFICYALHDIGNIELSITNIGIIGTQSVYDCITGRWIEAGCVYPKGSHVQYLYDGALWIGAVVGQDTLVSVGTGGWSAAWEFRPDMPPFGGIQHRSIIGPDGGDPEAVSEQDLICQYSDTLTEGVPADFFNFRPHIPLHVEMTQRSYAWSYAYAEDFVIFDFGIYNMSDNILNDVYIGLYIDGDVGIGDGITSDDLCGFLTHVASPFGCGFVDTINAAWIADNDGDPIDGEWVAPPRRTPIGGLEGSARHVTGVSILQAPAENLKHSFNWWISNQDPALDFGPRQKGNVRDFRTGGLGTPEGDINKYYVLSNNEFDYDQAFTANISPFDERWLYPNQEHAADWADGFDTRYLLSYGAFTVYPGQTLPLTFAYVAGENFHNNVNNLDNLPDDPIAYYANLDFSDLALNSMWARWIYDNPGVDTDGDGYFGEYRVCIYDSALTDTGWIVTAADTQWYRGDGIPDFRGAAPPPAPEIWVSSLVDGLHVRFNGHRSETEKDIFSGIADFEGYRVYFGRDNRRESLALVASYDRENYDKYFWNNHRVPNPGWELRDIPFTLDSLRCLYGRGVDPCNDSTFNPLAYTPGDPYTHPPFDDSLFYFVAHDYNTYMPGVNTPIRKRYPDAPDPRGVPADSLTPEYYTEDGYLKYYEYEYTIENLLPTVSYWINVTAFDFGSPRSNLDALETSMTLGAIEAYPYNSQAEAAGTTDEVYVYPNPYRIDSDYRARGFEGRMQEDRPDYRVRAIHFTNLPPKCTIRIHSLDGDLVRELQHDVDPSDPTSHDHEWDLITRNTQMIVTGLYYWSVESPDGRVQMGKLVILM